ncbi:branched-chain amino acid transporter AzlD family protein 2 [Bordetella genomosp. 5]|uniref:Branched-chain amino acid transporter AzlD family protein 2 n=1 Tax=Bordetella genomosp. 5 TaxID=1395608 RepID=A0A261TAK9_9BORD|nr:AzlD domain-containing protein [Bordetella genomosp. 5]OZI45673.1 branched-chain amino acid transporter AzlD family protein 2 [Bordetella genomosp. 5]OZI46195.1 branched-chain amino acid transporter AzlD family protein 2 [Bordetella genomosp. 5]
MSSGLEFWVAVLAMAVITFMTRALPFMLSSRHWLLKRLSQDGSRLAVLGPALLAAIAAAVIVPDLWGEQQVAQVAPYVGGLIVTALAARITGNTGLAVIIGLAGYGGLLAVM